MSSWGSSWGDAWASAWGDVTTNPGSIRGTASGSSTASGTLSFITVAVGGGIGHSKTRVAKPKIAVVTIDGQDYRIPIDRVQSFLDAQVKKLEVVKPVKVVKKNNKKTVKVENKPPQIVIKSAPVEMMPMIQSYIDKSNEILRIIWERTIARMIQDMEDDDAIAMLLLME